jgi:hypothetical protein
VKRHFNSKVVNDVGTNSMSSLAYRMGANQAETPDINNEPLCTHISLLKQQINGAD